MEIQQPLKEHVSRVVDTLAESSFIVSLTTRDPLAKEAEANGLLTPEFIESLLRAEIRRRRVNKLFVAADRLADSDLPTLTETEVEAEIATVPQSRRTPDASRS
jgi:hypothetical protein